MALTDLLRRRRQPSGRYLRALLGEFRRIADALEHQNKLYEAWDPAAAHSLTGPRPEPTAASSVSYVDSFTIRIVEQEQARIYQQTGVAMDPEQVYERLVQEGRIES